MNLLMTRLFLGLAGAFLAGIGSAVLLLPETFAAANGIALADDPSMLSEYRAPGGMLAASGVFVLLGAVRRQYMRAALALAALVFGSYGVARLIGLSTDGTPSPALTQAMVIELLLGAICLLVLFQVKRTQGDPGQR